MKKILLISSIVVLAIVIWVIYWRYRIKRSVREADISLDGFVTDEFDNHAVTLNIGLDFPIKADISVRDLSNANTTGMSYEDIENLQGGTKKTVTVKLSKGDNVYTINGVPKFDYQGQGQVTGRKFEVTLTSDCLGTFKKIEVV